MWEALLKNDRGDEIYSPVRYATKAEAEAFADNYDEDEWPICIIIQHKPN